MFINRWVRKIHLYAMEYFSIMRKDKLEEFRGKYKQLKSKSETNEVQELKYGRFLIWEIQNTLWIEHVMVCVPMASCNHGRGWVWRLWLVHCLALELVLWVLNPPRGGTSTQCKGRKKVCLSLFCCSRLLFVATMNHCPSTMSLCLGAKWVWTETSKEL